MHTCYAHTHSQNAHKLHFFQLSARFGSVAPMHRSMRRVGDDAPAKATPTVSAALGAGAGEGCADGRLLHWRHFDGGPHRSSEGADRTADRADD
mmetsp:Transcript_27311/g.73428  ORF Transcript_27311/g.73428 Transcript_27311/m.73428 type:complete len:94 (+) Transcript_27311:113-394(+)